MGERTEKIRLATGVFYDLDRLLRALSGFLELGLSVEDLRLAAPASMMMPGSALQRALAEGGGDLAQLADGADAGNGTARFEALLAGEIGANLRAHLEHGAIIATAMSRTPAQQDECMRVLLRHSLHTVHAQECPRSGGDAV